MKHHWLLLDSIRPSLHKYWKCSHCDSIISTKNQPQIKLDKIKFFNANRLVKFLNHPNCELSLVLEITNS